MFAKKQQVRFAPYLSHTFSLSLQSGKLPADWLNGQELLRPYQGGSHVACLDFKTSCVSVYKCSSFIVRFAITVAIWPREVVSCHDFILHAVATFWAMSLVGIYPGRASLLNYEFLEYLNLILNTIFSG